MALLVSIALTVVFSFLFRKPIKRFPWLFHLIAALAGVYSPRVIASPASMANGMIVSFAIALVLAVLLVILTVTSFRAVKQHVKGLTWKNVQRLSYPFFVLIYAHVLLIMARPALQGAQNAQTSLVVYGLVVAAYVVLRLRRHLSERRVVVA